MIECQTVLFDMALVSYPWSRCAYSFCLRNRPEGKPLFSASCTTVTREATRNNSAVAEIDNFAQRSSGVA